MKLTAQIKLICTKEQKQNLLSSMYMFNEICNGISEYCFQEKEFKQFNLHKIFYYQVRDCYDIPSQFVIRILSKVADSYKLDKDSLRSFRPEGAITYDARILTWHEGFVGIHTGKRKEVIKFQCGKHQKKLLKFQKGETDLVYRGGEFYLYTTCEIEEKELVKRKKFLGVDVGIVNIATDSLGNLHGGGHLRNLRKRNKRLRTKLQKKGTKSAIRLLKKRKRKESRFAKDTNHCIAKKIVKTAQRHKLGIKLENLKGISKGKTVSKAQRYELGSWGFFDLHSKVYYKARRFGVEVLFVDPAYTSQECFNCNHISKSNRNGIKFKCKACGHTSHADYNASRVIARRAPVNVPNVGVSTTHKLAPLGASH